MGWTGIAINASMLATSIGIHAGIEAEIGAVDVGNDRARGILKELGLQRRVFRVSPLRIALVPQRFEAVRRIRRSAPPASWGRLFTHWAPSPHSSPALVERE